MLDFAKIKEQAFIDAYQLALLSGIKLRIENIDDFGKALYIALEQKEDAVLKYKRLTNSIFVFRFYLGGEIIEAIGCEWIKSFDEYEYYILWKNKSRICPIE